MDSHKYCLNCHKPLSDKLSSEHRRLCDSCYYYLCNVQCGCISYQDFDVHINLYTSYAQDLDELLKKGDIL